MSSHVLLEEDLLASEPQAFPRTSDTSSSTSAARIIALQGSKSYTETAARASRSSKRSKSLKVT